MSFAIGLWQQNQTSIWVNKLFKKPHAESTGRYTVNIDKEDLLEIYTKKWVLKWCKENHPEKFEEGKKFIEGLINKEEGIILNEKR